MNLKVFVLLQGGLELQGQQAELAIGHQNDEDKQGEDGQQLEGWKVKELHEEQRLDAINTMWKQS